jgi:hypothetical protein
LSGTSYFSPFRRWIVSWSGFPAKYFYRALPKIALSESTLANNVIEDRNLRSSGSSKICSMDLPSTSSTSEVQCLSRDPRIGCVKYASASFPDEIPYRFAIALCLGGAPRHSNLDALVSCFVAVMLLLPRILNVVGTRTILPFLIAVDPRTYLRIRGTNYWWNLLYFAVYFVLAFPFCLLALYAIYHEFYFPSNRLMHTGPLRLWWMGTLSALAASIITAPYNELLRASVVIPTPLMQTMQFSKLAQLLDEFKICVQLGRSGELVPLERDILACDTELKRILRQNKNDFRKTKESAKWVARLTKETKACFGHLSMHSLLEAQELPLSSESLQRISVLADQLRGCGASDKPEIVPIKVPVARRIARDALLVLIGVCLILFGIWLMARFLI